MCSGLPATLEELIGKNSTPTEDTRRILTSKATVLSKKKKGRHVTRRATLEHNNVHAPTWTGRALHGFL